MGSNDASAESEAILAAEDLSIPATAVTILKTALIQTLSERPLRPTEINQLADSLLSARDSLTDST